MCFYYDVWKPTFQISSSVHLSLNGLFFSNYVTEHRASVEGAFRVSSLNLLRLSIGLEDAADLIADLDEALRLAKEN